MSREPSAVAPHPAAPPSEQVLDLREHSKSPESPLAAMDRRLFMQLLVFDCPPPGNPSAAIEQLSHALHDQGANAVLYEDVNNPLGIAVLSFSEDPSDFVTRVRPCFTHTQLTLRPEFTMLGRTYSTGYETDLEYWLLKRPADTVQNAAWPWAVWYPLRRSGAFARLEGREQGSILREHAEIGKAYGAQDLAHDVRLACHGLDSNDNEFVIGLVGKELHPLSHVVQTMRKTRQTSEYISQMGPFFVGHAVRTIASR